MRELNGISMFGEVSSNSCHSTVLYSDIYSDWKVRGAKGQGQSKRVNDTKDVG